MHACMHVSIHPFIQFCCLVFICLLSFLIFVIMLEYPSLPPRQLGTLIVSIPVGAKPGISFSFFSNFFST
ncbi:hypothetical protein F4820DRAFT_434593 [Hypoxylon rubiginosum]|uniref:Uncharacterized protein n=1 Tax=Hypoxylon rubiginosum TaxID=110542 RepID=A0ACB9YQF4_9PEZI|nr:hypothetical protein F4820DRAFT_434593 [Hypoxylon rubiginosum]